jgi:hypothetical protein
MPKRFIVAMNVQNEAFVFVFPDGKQDQVLREAGKLARNKELVFGWYDAAMFSLELEKTKDRTDRTEDTTFESLRFGTGEIDDDEPLR